MTAYIQDGGSAVNPPHADDAPRSRAEFTYPATEVIRERLRHVLAAHPHLTNNGSASMVTRTLPPVIPRLLRTGSRCWTTTPAANLRGRRLTYHATRAR